MFRYHLRAVPAFGYLLLSMSLLASALQAGTISTGTPGAAGTVNITVTLPGGAMVPVSVPVPKNSTAAQKATAIFNGFKNAGIPNLGYIGANTVTAAGSQINVTGDDTAENLKVADLGGSSSTSAAYATLGFDGPLSALGTDGSPSVFTASFGADNSTFSSASVTYNQLSAPTADGLAIALYTGLLADLSPSLQSSLFLNLPTNSITFDFAPGSGNYFAQSSSTSPGTSQFMNVVAAAPTPEPVTFLSLGTGFVLIGVWKRRVGKKIAP